MANRGKKKTSLRNFAATTTLLVLLSAVATSSVVLLFSSSIIAAVVATTTQEMRGANAVIGSRSALRPTIVDEHVERQKEEGRRTLFVRDYSDDEESEQQPLLYSEDQNVPNPQGIAFQQIRRAKATTSSPLDEGAFGLGSHKQWTCTTTIQVSFCNSKAPCVFEGHSLQECVDSSKNIQWFCPCNTNNDKVAAASSNINSHIAFRSHVYGIRIFFSTELREEVQERSKRLVIVMYSSPEKPLSRTVVFARYYNVLRTERTDAIVHKTVRTGKGRKEEGGGEDDVEIIYTLTNEQLWNLFSKPTTEDIYYPPDAKPFYLKDGTSYAFASGSGRND